MPGQVTLTAASEHTPPQPTHAPSEREERRIIHGHAVVPHVSRDHRTHVRAEFREGPVHDSGPAINIPKHGKYRSVFSVKVFLQACSGRQKVT